MTFDLKKFLKITSLSLFLLFIITFAFFRSKDLIFGVKIKNVKINSLEALDFSRAEKYVLVVTGNAKKATNVTLNGRNISLDQTGNFNEHIAINKGYNIVSIEAKDGFGKSNKKNYKIIY